MSIKRGESGEAISEEIQKEMLIEMLDAIMERCEEKGWKCMLTWGTLLGAVRHHGFIPWDDDIDVMMSREDYEAFRKDVLEHPLAENSIFIDPDHPVSDFLPYMAGKIGRSDTVIHYPGYGKKFELIVSIDIFPMDNVPDDDEILNAYFNESREVVQAINRIIYLPAKSLNPIHYVISYLRKFIWKKLFYKKLINDRKELAVRYRNAKTNRIGFPANFDGGCPSTCIRKECIKDVIKLPFNGKEYNVPVGYDEILRNTYGDYMQLPPEDKRVSWHDYSEVLWR